MFLIDGMRERSWLLTAASIKSFTFELRREWLYVSRPVNLFSLLPSINPSINFNLFNQLSFLLFKDSCCPREPKWKQFKNCWNGVGPRERSLRLITNQLFSFKKESKANQSILTNWFDWWLASLSLHEEEKKSLLLVGGCLEMKIKWVMGSAPLPQEQSIPWISQFIPFPLLCPFSLVAPAKNNRLSLFLFSLASLNGNGRNKKIN